MQIKAQLNHVHFAPRKVRMLSRVIRGLDYSAARYQLSNLTKASSRSILKLLDSAAANGQSNYGMVKENLFVKDMSVNEGPTMKRYKPKGFGSSMPIARRTSHVTIVLEEKEPGLRVQRGTQKKEGGADNDGASVDVRPTDEKKTAHTASQRPRVSTGDARRDPGAKESGFSRLKRFFRRKSV